MLENPTILNAEWNLTLEETKKLDYPNVGMLINIPETKLVIFLVLGDDEFVHLGDINLKGLPNG